MKSICLSGGGVTGLAHVGVLQYLEENDALRTVNTYVGTSIGAVVATLHVIGCTSNEILKTLTQIDAKTALNFASCARFFDCFGVDSGEYFMAHLIDQFMKKAVLPTVTFKDILTLFGKRLIMTGTNLETHLPVYFGPETHSDMRILDAVRISVSVPFILSPVRYKGDLYVDGGLTDNFPFQYCVEDSGGDCLAACICSMPPRPNNNIEDVIYNVLAASLNSKRQKLAPDRRIIYIPTTTFDSFSFAASEHQKMSLYRLGFLAAQRHLTRTVAEVPKAVTKTRRHSI